MNIQLQILVCATALLGGLGTAHAQRAELRPANPIRLAGTSDSNSPVYREGGKFVVFQSYSLPLIVEGTSQAGPLRARPVLLNSFAHYPLWIESVWADDDGALYAWYHHEQWICSSGLSAPVIGALVSRDGGNTFQDLGIILESGYPTDCSAKNGFFAGGHGDFTVLLDGSRQFFYFTNYSGPADSQGVAVARLPFSARSRPIGQVLKFYQNNWTEPGLKGRLTAIMPAKASWTRADTDLFWGPSLHWNTHLQQFVMLLNRTCCEPGWPQEGVYVSYNPDLSIPTNWSAPVKLLDRDQARWYPQVIGRPPSGTDRLAGRIARFYMGGDSAFEIVFDY